MVSITVSVPVKVKEIMKQFPEMNWSGLVKTTIENKVRELSWRETMLKKLDSESKYDELALEIGDKVKEGMWKRYKSEGW